MKYNRKCNVVGLVFIALVTFTGCNRGAKETHDNMSNNTPISGKGFTDTAASSVKVFDQNGRVCVQQSSVSYEVVNLKGPEGNVPVLLKIKKTELCFADSINKDKVYEITAKSVMDTKPVNWETSFVATDISFKDNTILAVKEGTDEEQDFLKRFSMQDGKEVFSCSFADLEAKIPNVINKFFVGYTSKKAASNPLALLHQENLIGVLRLGSSAGAMDSVTVKLKRSKVADKLLNSVPDLVLEATNENTRAIDDGHTVILMHADKNYQNKDATDFGVKFTYYFGDDNETTFITVPVVNGKLDATHAKYDKDIFEVAGF